MDDGLILATGTPPSCWHAPACRRWSLHRPAARGKSAAMPAVVIPPLQTSDDIAIEARDLTMRLATLWPWTM
jgi:hypothetical protein